MSHDLKIAFSTSCPTVFPLYHHYKLAAVSTSTCPFPLHIAIHPLNSYNSITSSSPLIGPHNAKQSASCPPPPTCTLLADPLLPPQSNPSTSFYSQLRSSSPKFHQHPLDPLTLNIYISCLALTLHQLLHHLQL